MTPERSDVPVAVRSDVPVAVLSRSFSNNEVLRAELSARYADVRFNDTNRTLAGDELVAHLEGRRRIIVALERIDADLLDRLPSLEVIGKYGVGLDNVDLHACAARGVLVGWTGGVNRRSVCELVIAQLINTMRHVVLSDREVRSGTFRQIIGRQLSDSTVGVIGLGHVGRELVPLLQAFGATVIGNDIRDASAFAEERGIELASKDDIYARCDAITLHVPLTPQTRNMIDARALSAMQPRTVLINTARGGIVDEAALAQALAAGTIAAAACDVFSPEPPTDQTLIQQPNFIATSHIGGSAAEAVLAMGRAAIDGLETAVHALDHVPDYLTNEGR